MALRRRCPGLCDAVYTLPLLGRHLCAHDSSGDLGWWPKGEQASNLLLDVRAKRGAALLSHAHIISKTPHYCTTKAPHR